MHLDLRTMFMAAFAVPFVLPCLMPGFRSLAVCASVSFVTLAVAFFRFDAGINENNDGPASIFVVALFAVALIGLVAGSIFRALILAFQSAQRARAAR